MLACRSIRPLIIAASLGFSTAAVAQTPGSAAPAPTIVVRVHVADSTGAPIAGADISLVQGLTQILARGLSNDRGDQSFTIARTGADNALVVRKIGYRRADQFFNDTLPVPAFQIVLERAPNTLDTVRVVAREDPVRASYYIDADAIENSPRVIVDALDIVTRLRPDMIWGRRGVPDEIGMHPTGGGAVIISEAARIRQGLKYGYCPPVSNVWVNGSRIRDISINAGALLRLTGHATAINSTIATVLASIKPEHVAEIQYHPCTEIIPAAPPGATNAIFVTLKPGIGFRPGLGSYVIEPRAPYALNRILGVFDEATGDPLPDVQVVDVSTGTSARTTVTGTVTLAFIPAGEWTVRIAKPGYDTLTMPVTISPRDTTPITVVLSQHTAVHGRP